MPSDDAAIRDGRVRGVPAARRYHPESGFSVGAAMGRNKLVYAMADHALVVSATLEKGGTWEGAVEELRREDPRPVFVRAIGSTLRGNEGLVARGARRFPEWSPDDDPASVLRAAAAGAPLAPGRQGRLFDAAREPSSVRESARGPMCAADVADVPEEAPGGVRPAPAQTSVYEAVLPLILAELDDAVAADELAARLEVKKTQLSAWLARAVAEERVRKLARPARYIRRGA